MKGNRLPAFCLVLVCWFGSSVSSFGTTVERLTLEALANRAGRIVEGTVRGSRSYWSSNRKLILTTTTIEVDDAIKGRSTRSIEITTVGGQVGDAVLYVAGMAKFRPGESTIVFVEESGVYLTVLGLAQGKFSVSNGQVSNSTADLTSPDGRSLRPFSMPVQTFKSEIRSILERKPR
jgi:hypothetical protein